MVDLLFLIDVISIIYSSACISYGNMKIYDLNGVSSCTFVFFFHIVTHPENISETPSRTLKTHSSSCHWVFKEKVKSMVSISQQEPCLFDSHQYEQLQPLGRVQWCTISALRPSCTGYKLFKARRWICSHWLRCVWIDLPLQISSSATLEGKGQLKFTSGKWSPHHNSTQLATANDTAIRGWDLRSMRWAQGSEVTSMSWKLMRYFHIALKSCLALHYPTCGILSACCKI